MITDAQVAAALAAYDLAISNGKTPTQAMRDALNSYTTIL